MQFIYFLCVLTDNALQLYLWEALNDMKSVEILTKSSSSQPEKMLQILNTQSDFFGPNP